MLDDILTFPADHKIFRFANLIKDSEALRALGLDPSNVETFSDYLTPYSANDLLDAPFQIKPQIDKASFPQSRFSDGSWSVFYAALEQATTEAEIVHHYLKPALGKPSQPRTVYFDRLSCHYRGNTKDLRPKLSQWSKLVSNDHGFCQELGRKAIAEQLDGFFAPSARRDNGTTVPVFQRRALNNGKVLDRIAFSMNPQTGKISTKNL